MPGYEHAKHDWPSGSSPQEYSLCVPSGFYHMADWVGGNSMFGEHRGSRDEEKPNSYRAARAMFSWGMILASFVPAILLTATPPCVIAQNRPSQSSISATSGTTPVSDQGRSNSDGRTPALSPAVSQDSASANAKREPKMRSGRGSSPAAVNVLATIMGEPDITNVAMSPEGSFVLIGSERHSTVVFATYQGTVLWKYQLPAGIETESAAISRDARLVVVGGQRGSVFAFSRDGNLVWRDSEIQGECEVAVSADGERVFAAQQRPPLLKCYNAQGQKRWEVPVAPRGWQVWQLATTAKGDRVLAGTNSDIILFDGLGKEIGFYDIVEGNRLASADISPDGREFAVIVHHPPDEAFVELYSVADGKRWQREMGRMGSVRLDGNGHVFTSDADNYNRLWGNDGTLLTWWPGGGRRFCVNEAGTRCVVEHSYKAVVYGLVDGAQDTAQAPIEGGSCTSFDTGLMPALWPTHDGGTGHYYEIVDLPASSDWPTARKAAEARSYLGMPGRLATITSAEENHFISDTLLVASPEDRLWIGGYQDPREPGYPEPKGQWRWITGEAWDYANWSSNAPGNSAPSAQERFLEIWARGDRSRLGTWSGRNGVGGNHGNRGCLIEYASAAPRTTSKTGDGLDVLAVLPRPPLVLKTGEDLFVEVLYTLRSENQCGISVSPLFKGKRLAVRPWSRGSFLCPKGTGRALRCLAFGEPVKIDQLQVTMTAVSARSSTLAEQLVDVDVRWEGPRLVVQEPPRPAPTAQNPTTANKLGEPAPTFKTKHWIKGDPIDLGKDKGKHVYVLEFWATWCGPCRASIPHLTQLQHKYRDKGVVVIGITSEPLATVKAFVEQMGDQMDYSVAIDDEKASEAAYLKAFNISGIPHAFVVDKQGRILWHGHPENQLDSVVEAVVTGTYDLEAVKKTALASEMFAGYFRAVAAAETAKQHAGEIGETILRDGKTNANLLNTFAWLILSTTEIKDRDLNLAMRAAKAAYDACEGKNDAVVDTYARALFDNGRIAEAIEYQEKALKLAVHPDQQQQLRERLERYRKAAGGRSSTPGS